MTQPSFSVQFTTWPRWTPGGSIPAAPPVNPAPRPQPSWTARQGGLSTVPSQYLGNLAAARNYAGSAAITGFNKWFVDTIWIKPLIMDFGSIFAPKVLTITFLNTYRTEVRTLQAIDLTAIGAGVSLTSGSIPFTLTHLEQDSLQFTATPDGDPNFDGFGIFEWDHRDIPIRFLGTRLVPFTLDADMNDPINQAIAYVTDIMRAKRGDEQRVQLKEIPRIALEFSVMCVDERDAQLLQTMLQGWQFRVYGVPIWQDGQRLPVALSPNDTVINLPTTANYDFEVGGICFIWGDAHTWEAVTVEAINPTSLTVAPVSGSWPVGTIILPMKLGRLSPTEDLVWHDVDIASARLRFSMEATEL